MAPGKQKQNVTAACTKVMIMIMIMIMSSLKALSRLTCYSSDQDVVIPKCRTKLFQFSYCNHAKLWNTLTESTRTLTFLNQFISHFLQRYSAAFLTNYDVNNFDNWKSICSKCSRSRNLFTLFTAAGVNRFFSTWE